ncbi:MAG TPA: hypothetical protein VE996_00960 [Terriglobales bacterium]|nr:hypothetical protein [Terriglobales bacterium]
MGFGEFIGDAPAVARLRELIAAGGLNRALLLAGPRGVGKTTLAIFAGLALNCEQPPAPGDFCGACASCRQLDPGWRDLEAMTAAALEFREQQGKTRAREEAPLVLRVHPEIEIYPPDGDFLSMAQARRIGERGHRRSDRGRYWTVIVPEFERARWMTQATLLKTLEEPPPRTALLLLAENPLELLPTVRSRALLLTLPPASPPALARLLAERRGELSAAEREAVARWSQGRPGRALRLDPAEYRELRRQALLLLATAGGSGPWAPLFEMTQQAARPGKERLESLVEILYSLLQDILYLLSDRPEAIRNADCRAELSGLAQQFNLRSVAFATEEADRVLAATRRNAQRGLALEAWALRLARA